MNRFYLSSIVDFRIFCLYLNKYIDSNKLLKKYDLDTEYNRDIEGFKRLANRPNGWYPDLILHKRGSNENNILIIECKGWLSDADSSTLIAHKRP